MEPQLKTSRGFPLPFGTSRHVNGINFSLFSKHATHVSLCLFQKQQPQPLFEIALDPKTNKTGDVWHVFIYELPEDLTYGYRLEGPYEPFEGLYYDKRSIVLDPYAKRVESTYQWGQPYEPKIPHQTRGYVAPLTPFHWGDVSSPRIPLNELIIYEMHVRGFTQDPSSGVKHPGSFLGMIEKIPFLKELGVNAVELLPIFEFNELENRLLHPITKEPHYQYWGYSTINFFSPMNRFGVSETITEFKTLVKELHANGIEVILDVVYNHTAEGNQDGPILSFKGIENPAYYILGPNGEYYNYTGCGNTVNCNHPVTLDLIRSSLRYWVTEMHVDGFRFDLASIMTRSQAGLPLENPPLIEALTLDPVLANVKFIAEAWDAVGLYQVGSFPGVGWSEWNGRYRDEVRRFLKGTDGEVGHFATRLSGSEDLYGKRGSPLDSINFVTAHDGFTLADLVAYNDKHNEDNGEENRDGTNDNASWNCGVEGPTDDPKIIAIRKRQMRNLHLALLVSQGIPMLHMGDEYGHSKNGNNNTWCQDNRINWFQWDNLEKNPDFFRFYKKMIEFRKMHPVLSHPLFLKENDVRWHGKEPFKPDWSPQSRFLAFSLPDHEKDYVLYVAFNAFFDPIIFHLPTTDRRTPWYRIVDTSKAPPEDFIDVEKANPVELGPYTLPPYSALLLKRKLNP